MLVELERTWTYIWKTKYEDIVSWTRKNLNLPTKTKYENIVSWTGKNLNLPTTTGEKKYEDIVSWTK